MQAYRCWCKMFCKAHLEEHFNEKIKNGDSMGLDRITPKKFSTILNEEIEIIIRKTNNSSYRFTNYRQLLFSKGVGKLPRCICIPTVRDKLTVSVLNELLSDVYEGKTKTPLPQTVIDEIVNNVSNYDYFIKIDIKGFYSSINQEYLKKKIRKKIRKKEILYLIDSAIKTNAISLPKNKSKLVEEKDIGIPEGLSISNSLANIFMIDLDEKYRKKTSIAYWRYVDDILLLFNSEESAEIARSLNKDINRLGLEVNDKKDEGLIKSGFEYLGYMISEKMVSVRIGSILKIEQSIETIFRSYRGKNNFNYLIWKINLKVTGFIIDEHKYGWLFFYSQINDLSLLYRLDFLINKLNIRYFPNKSLEFKRFVRSYHEIRKSLTKTNYVPNIDRFTADRKKEILSKIYDVDISNFRDDQIEYNFRKIMSKEIYDVEKDIQSIS